MKRSGGAFRLARDFGRRGRRLVVVDIENLLGVPQVSPRDVDWARMFLGRFVDIKANDLVVVGTSSSENALAVGTTWPDARLVVRFGHDSADLELLDAMNEDVPERFTHLVLVSGDGIFAGGVAELARRGVPTAVVARTGSLSARLRLAATTFKCVATPVRGSNEGQVA